MIATLLTAVILGFVIAFAWWRFYFFHRNPVRHLPAGDGLVCSADGRIVYRDRVDLIERSEDAYYRRVQHAFDIEGAWSVTATYLSIFDVHVVRAPLAGRVRLRPIACETRNQPMGAPFFFAALSRPLPLGLRSYREKNEILGLDIEGDIRVLLVLMADWWIDQIEPFVRDGDYVERGQPVGRILMGSQVDVWVPIDTLDVSCEVGARVRAGETILGDFMPRAGSQRGHVVSGECSPRYRRFVHPR